MRIITAALLLVVSACSSTPTAPTTPPTTPTTEQPATADALPSWTTAGRQYAGAPVGGRGGRYLIDVCKDGRYHHLLLDATVHGTWTAVPGGVALKGTAPEGLEQTLPLSADGQMLGEMRYVGAPVCPQ